MKLIRLLLVLFTTVTSALGQINLTNYVFNVSNNASPTEAIKVASQLKVGLREEEARKILATNGLTRFDGFGREGMWDNSYLLSNGKWLLLGYTGTENVTDGL